MGYIKIITAILIWSSLGIFVRKSGLPTVGIIFYPAVVAGLLQFSILSTTGTIKGQIKNGKNANSIVLLALVPVCFLANTLLFYFAFKHTTIANAVLTHYTAPIFVALMAPVLLKERVPRTAWLAIMISSVGLWLILGVTGSGDGISLGESERRGIIAGVLSGLAYALIILIIREISSKYSALFIVFVQNSIIALVLLPFVLAIPLSTYSLPYIITMGIVHSTIAPLLYVQGIESVKANEAAILGYFEPVGAVILALIFLHEIPGIEVLLGGAFILFSGLMIVGGRGQ